MPSFDEREDQQMDTSQMDTTTVDGATDVTTSGPVEPSADASSHNMPRVLLEILCLFLIVYIVLDYLAAFGVPHTHVGSFIRSCVLMLSCVTWLFTREYLFSAITRRRAGRQRL